MIRRSRARWALLALGTMALASLGGCHCDEEPSGPQLPTAGALGGFLDGPGESSDQFRLFIQREGRQVGGSMRLFSTPDTSYALTGGTWDNPDLTFSLLIPSVADSEIVFTTTIVQGVLRGDFQGVANPGVKGDVLALLLNDEPIDALGLPTGTLTLKRVYTDSGPISLDSLLVTLSFLPQGRYRATAQDTVGGNSMVEEGAFAIEENHLLVTPDDDTTLVRSLPLALYGLPGADSLSVLAFGTPFPRFDRMISVPDDFLLERFRAP